MQARNIIGRARAGAPSGHRSATPRVGPRSLAVTVATMLLTCLPATAAPVQLDCAYPVVADPRDGFRTAREPLQLLFTIDREANTARVRSGEFETDLELQFYQRHLRLTQTTGNESQYITVIVFDAFDEQDLYRTVHSRHAIIGSLGELRASQYYGRCEPVFSDEE